MLKTGAQYLDGIRDGFRVYLGKECVDDVTAYPAFGNAAHMYAAITVTGYYGYCHRNPVTVIPIFCEPALGRV